MAIRCHLRQELACDDDASFAVLLAALGEVPQGGIVRRDDMEARTVTLDCEYEIPVADLGG